MKTSQRLKVVLCWHMHQPEYRVDGVYQQPWTYLHAIKDYVDMAVHIEAVPNARAVVNFAPILLEQLQDYADQLEAFLNHNHVLRDPMLAALGAESLKHLSVKERLTLFKACQKADRERLIERFPAYMRLVDLADFIIKEPKDLYYLSEQYLWDLLFWYHLAWLGETVRRDNAHVATWIEKGRGFSQEDRQMLLRLIRDLVASVIPRYKVLAEQGKIELSFTPYTHPIVPLMLNLRSAREAMPDIELPAPSSYPGGTERAAWHVEKGLEIFQKHFGFTPTGCWPSEGSVSMKTLDLLAQYDVRWVATGQTVLSNSLKKTAAGEQTVHRPYRLIDNSIYCFFRDDQLSDAIGFEYAKWHADDAVANFIHNLVEIAKKEDSEVVSIILDGENAWEYYPENAWYFLSALYKELAEHPQLELTTFADCVEDATVEPGALSKLVAGSWVYGTFSTWIGHSEKNRGWEMLCEAKHVYDIRINKLQGEQREAAEYQMAVCEGSDWFWWFGDYNPSDSVSDFELLYRQQLTELYRRLGVEPPAYLSESFTRGGGAPAAGGTMRRNA